MITIISILLFTAVAYWTIAMQKYKNFKRFLKTGDPIRFYIGEEKHYGHVKSIGRKYVHIKTLNLTGKPVVRKIIFDNTYPVFNFRYKKSFD